MNHCVVQKNNFAACEDIWSRSVEKKDTVLCPKPRRLGLVHNTVEPSYMRALRWHVSHQQEDYDSKASNDLLDIILAKGSNGTDQQQSIVQLSSSPPFFNGSPPSRASNPLIQDSHFLDQEKMNSPNVSPRTIVQSPPSARKAGSGGCVRAMSFGNDPAVRIEGFDCRGQRNCSIPALA